MLCRGLECDREMDRCADRDLMHQVEPLPNAEYAVFHCADVNDEGIAYHESMAVADCYHPQNDFGLRAQ